MTLQGQPATTGETRIARRQALSAPLPLAKDESESRGYSKFPYTFLTPHSHLPYRNTTLPHEILPAMEKEHIMLDLWFVALGLGLIGLLAGYLALLRKA